MPHCLPPLIPAGLSVERVLPAPDRVTIFTVPTPPQSACPLCGGISGRVHSRYTRTPADLPWQGRAVAVQVRARRFRCTTAVAARTVVLERHAAKRNGPAPGRLFGPAQTPRCTNAPRREKVGRSVLRGRRE